MIEMAKIIIVGDVHLGKRYTYRVNLKTGMSDRTLDFINALSRVVTYAIENKADILIIAGDLFDRVTVGPTLLRLVRENIWYPLIKAKIPIVCIGGNHDSPQIHEKGSPLGEISLIPNSTVSRTPATIKVQALNSKEEVGFLLLPYQTASQVVKFVEKRLGKPVEKERQMVLSQEYLKYYIENEMKQLTTKSKIIVGHYFFQGSKINIIPYPDLLPHEFKFKKDMLPLAHIDLAVFGHVHTTQILHDGKVLVPGSLERVDFGETNEDKGFYVFETTTQKLEFISNNPRPLVKQVVEVPKVEDPTTYIIEKLPPTVTDAIVRIIIKISPELKNKVRIPRIHQSLESAFYFELFWDTSVTQRDVVLKDFVLDPLVLFNDFITKKFDQDPNLVQLRKTGLEILDRALAHVEEKL
ncbi:MAG: metallophosphoesterase family protein [Candidatus Hodarchaeales archaeon]|jgi:exonuclease SbcD